MAQRAELFDAGAQAARWIAEYRSRADPGDVLADTSDEAGQNGAWRILFEELTHAGGDDLAHVRDRVQRHAADIGTGFRVVGESEERPWPLSPIALMLAEAEWRQLASGVAQRARLMEAILRDLYGPGDLVSSGAIPAALVAGSPMFLRQLVGLTPPGGCHLHFVAVDLGRDADGRWRVMSDQLSAPAGAGYALENRLATARTLGGLQARLNVERHAPFFAAFRDGLASHCRRSDPRIGLLTPGRWNPSYPEQAHLARYLGFLLVEGDDLAVRDDQLYLRTIVGLKRVDATWRRVAPRFLDPLAFDSRSTIGVAGLMDAYTAGNVLLANAPGSGVLEAPAFAGYFARLAPRLLGEQLSLPGLATWWGGEHDGLAHLQAKLDELEVAPAFLAPPLGLPDGRPVGGANLDGPSRDALARDLARRPQDYVGQEMMRLATMPVMADHRLAPRPFILRVFAARGPDGDWVVLPGGFARIADHPDPRAAVIGEGTWSADVVVHGPRPVAPVSLLPRVDSIRIRRNPGTLPSRVADNFFWLGRYLERGEALLDVIRVMLGNSIEAYSGAALSEATMQKLVGLIAAAGAAPRPDSLARPALVECVRTALEATDGWTSVRALTRTARGIAAVSRDRLSADVVQLLDSPFPARGGMLDRAGTLQRRYAALSGLSAEHMGRGDAWRFHDLGRRIERGLANVRAARAVGLGVPEADALLTLLDLADSQISYRQRYLTGLAQLPVLDLAVLDPGNPRSLAFQLEGIGAHLAALPVLRNDGLPEAQQAEATALAAWLATARAETLDAGQLDRAEQRLLALSDAIAGRYFLQGAESVRAPGLMLA